MQRFSSLRTEKRRVISSYTTLLKFVHDIHGSNYILCPALRENFGLNLRARISSVRKTLKSKFHKLIAKYISVSPVDYDTPRRIPHAKVDTFASYVRIFFAKSDPSVRATDTQAYSHYRFPFRPSNVIGKRQYVLSMSIRTYSNTLLCFLHRYASRYARSIQCERILLT